MRLLWKLLILGIVLVVGAGVAGWYFFLKTDPGTQGDDQGNADR